MKSIDITLPLRHGMARYPADPAIAFETVLDVSKGDIVNLRQYCFGSHSGTHIDPPYHFFADGKKADELPADYFIGQARVLGLMSGRDIAYEDIASLGIQADEIVLFKTPNSAHMLDKDYYDEHVCVLPSAAQYLADIGVPAVGFDYLSIEKDQSFPTHRILLGAGIPIIEGLCLSDVTPGIYKMTGMVMLIEKSDGAPFRAILEK